MLRNDELPWSVLGTGPEELLSFCAQHDLTELVHARVHAFRRVRDWPDGVRAALERAAHASAVRELVRRQELVAVLDQLNAAGVRPILFKGAALGYTIYDTPSLRPRRDTDLLVRRGAIERVQAILANHGYRRTLMTEGELVMCQFELVKTDRLGLDHVFDVHWKISTQPVFADTLTYDELDAVAVAVPALGPGARAPAPVHALLLACLHPVMHHRDVERLLWLYDIHLLASRLSERQWDRFARLAVDRHVAAVCARQLDRVRARFATIVPSRVIGSLECADAPEASRAYLEPGRRWHDDLRSSLAGLPRRRDRLRLLREVVLPGPGYMLAAYGVGRRGVAALPLLYAHRVVRGVWKIATGRK